MNPDQVLNAATEPSIPRVLLIGYNGANNTGAEALLLADIEDLRAVLGPQVTLTVPSLNVANLQRYLKADEFLKIVRMPTIFLTKLPRLVRQQDLVMLVEGSSYMDTWTSALLWYFLYATHWAHRYRKACLAYAVDAGSLRPRNQRLVRREASKTDLIITRAQAAAERLRSWGVTAPIEVTADNAFNFQPNPRDMGWVKRDWPAAEEGLIGMAVVNFYLWPVVFRFWGRRNDCYKWPYYFSCSPERSQASVRLAAGYAAFADKLMQESGKAIALIAMEQLDEPFAKTVLARMQYPDRARIFSSREYNASQMTTLLRSLDLLITSRYHACVLSLAAQIPQIAVGHDLRLKTIYEELDLKSEFFIEPDLDTLFVTLEDRAKRLLQNPHLVQERLRLGYENHLTQAQRNRGLLRDYLQKHGWSVQG
ncbi:polysaccharide pyruvyl transferase family protein [candidate division KSB1 bacterium]|nr:polysaccharide pyruvyl transferase family protein [candidate division KSB1 bacterium]